MEELFLNMSRIRLAEPWWLLVLPLMALVAFWKYRLQRAKRPAIVFPGVEELRLQGFAVNPFLAALPGWFRWTALVLGAIALARPQAYLPQADTETSGVDIILALDVSESMQQKDFEGKTRLEAAQSVARQFIGKRSGDRVGLVVFSGKSFTQCPLTIDHQVLGMLLDNISSSSIKESGTAIGTAILTATNRLRASESRDKALVLLTDGENNAGEIAPVTAAQLAVQNGVRIYTIFAGRTEGGTVSVEASVSAGDSLSTVAVGRDDLEEIARISGGNSFSAGDFAGLRQTFRDIDRMEKSRLQSRVSARKAELFPWLLLPAFWLLVAEMALTNIRMIRIP